MQERATDAGRAVDELGSKNTLVRYLRTVFVSEDETCFYLFEAASPDVVREAARCASLSVERITEAATESKGDRR